MNICVYKHMYAHILHICKLHTYSRLYIIPSLTSSPLLSLSIILYPSSFLTLTGWSLHLLLAADLDYCPLSFFFAVYPHVWLFAPPYHPTPYHSHFPSLLHKISLSVPPTLVAPYFFLSALSTFLLSSQSFLFFPLLHPTPTPQTSISSIR